MVWDIRMDWGLCRTKAAGKWGLRDKLTYPVHCYYTASVLNIIIRWTWLSTAFIEKDYTFLDTYAWGTFKEFLSVFRRWFWALLRIENEHVNNFEKYRTILEIPELDDYEADTKVEET
jgi:hypothetical protein